METTGKSFFFQPRGLNLAQLSPEQAQQCLAVLRFTRQQIRQTMPENTAETPAPYGTQGNLLHGKHLLIALSGGADSLCLLSILLALRTHADLTLSIAHFDHGLRPDSAEQAAAVQAQCLAAGLDCILEREDIATWAAQHKLGIEEAARERRYAFLERTARVTGADYIATGHHAGDLAEDILMRLLRGTGWPALGGMVACDPVRRLLRPLLELSRASIEHFLTGLGFCWLEDSSNKDTTLLRNHVRHNLLPALQKKNTGFMEISRNLWQQAAQDRDFWEKETALARKKAPDFPALLPKSLLTPMHPALRIRLCKAALDALSSGAKAGQARARTLFLLEEAFVAKKTGKIFQFPGRKQATITAEGIHFSIVSAEKNSAS